MQFLASAHYIQYPKLVGSKHQLIIISRLRWRAVRFFRLGGGYFWGGLGIEGVAGLFSGLADDVTCFMCSRYGFDICEI